MKNSFDQTIHQILSPKEARCISELNQIPVITVPVKMSEKIKKAQRKRKLKEKLDLRDKSRMGDKSVVIISSQNNKLNHYKGQSYGRFQDVPLISQGWGNRKSVGKHFTINSHGGNLAFTLKTDLKPTKTMKNSPLSLKFLSLKNKVHIINSSTIKALAIPEVLNGSNTLISAETGNGKTLAFLAPMLQQISARKNNIHDMKPNTPLGLIIAPGRELAQQISSVAEVLSAELGIKTRLIQGGRTKQLVLNPTVEETHLVIATLGALSKLTTSQVYDMSLVQHITLDEADSLFDDSFNEKIMHYLGKIPIRGSSQELPGTVEMSGAQLTLVSATTPRSLDTILEPILETESLIKITTPYLHRLMPHVPQRFIRVSHTNKATKLLEIAKKSTSNKTPIIIFSNTSKSSDWVSLFLNENNVSCINLHGDMSAVLREGRFDAFQSGKVMALSCTDLTSRGLDTVKAGHVINFDFPKYMADYIHRCGRTGRVGSTRTGLVTSFIHRNFEVELVQKIEVSYTCIF
ncbi:unnamed protein product [Meganyctiphanes norvegica]|uniref:RNA helicase n=1 Tax=Meganyctiphanes norvegica TaxID=48144 RepID=A0AAV2QD39_MEGNR